MLTRSSLKKDVSYERQPSSSSSSPGCQTKPRLGSSSSSSEDITTRTPRTFSDVIIDPVPGQGRRSAPEVMFFCPEQISFESSFGFHFPKEQYFVQIWMCHFGILPSTICSLPQPSRRLHTEHFMPIVILSIPLLQFPPQTPVKKGSGCLRPHASSLLPAGSMRISADGNLASKLARLAGEADSIR